ncbi:MAG: ABC transporter permease [Candidatus Korarchaeum sp.]
MMEAIKNMLAMIELEMRRLRHDRTEMYFRVVQPVLWITVYAPVMSRARAIPTGGVPYIDFITPGVIVQAATFVSIFYGLTIVWERDSGILKRLLVTPAPRYSIVIGRAMASGVRAIFPTFIIIPIALALGVRLLPNPAYLIAALVLIFLCSGGFAALSILIVSLTKTRERLMGVGQAVVMPLFFASNALYPVSMMPSILREIALINPLSYMVDAARGLMITGDTSGLLLDALAIASFDALMFTLSSITFRRILE